MSVPSYHTYHAAIHSRWTTVAYSARISAWKNCHHPLYLGVGTGEDPRWVKTKIRALDVLGQSSELTAHHPQLRKRRRDDSPGSASLTWPRQWPHGASESEVEPFSGGEETWKRKAPGKDGSKSVATPAAVPSQKWAGVSSPFFLSTFCQVKRSDLIRSNQRTYVGPSNFVGPYSASVSELGCLWYFVQRYYVPHTVCLDSSFIPGSIDMRAAPTTSPCFLHGLPQTTKRASF